MSSFLITQGIGTPAAIPEFLLVGLTMGEQGEIIPASPDVIVQALSLTGTVYAQPFVAATEADVVSTIYARQFVQTVKAKRIPGTVES